MSVARARECVSFCGALAGAMECGESLLAALASAGKKLAGTPLAEVSAALVAEIRAGRDLSDAMADHPSVFTRAVRTMVRAGEAGGVLDVVFKRIAEGIEDGSFPVPGAPRPEGGDMVRYWRAFGRLVTSGVPLLEMLDILGEESDEGGLRKATESVRAALMEGSSMSGAMRRFPEVFDERIVMAVGWGETNAKLAQVALRIADALESGDMSGLPSLDPAEAPGRLTKHEETTPVVKLVNVTILEALKAGASDVHIEPTETGAGRVRYRIDGTLVNAGDAGELPKDKYQAVTSRIKIMAHMDIAEKRRPQDGKIRLTMSGKPYDLRVSVLPTVRGESVVLRILASGAVMRGLDSFGLGTEDLSAIRGLARLPYGIVICSGPAGSGKSTLLYGMVQEIDRSACCVVSVENPVEYRLDGVRQVQVNPKLGLTFPVMLRSVMRQDPDVVIVGDIRDLETADIAQRLAVTGHLIMTTMHTPTASATVRRLLDLGLAPFQVNAALAGVVSQRLVRKLCPDCKVGADVSEAGMPKEAVEFLKSREGTSPTAVYTAKGCDNCRGGYKGRMPIHEILVPNEAFRKAVAGPADEESLREAAMASGMKTLFHRGMERAIEGLTSVEEVCRVAWDAR